MAKKSKVDIAIEFLIANGWREVESSSYKYRKFKQDGETHIDSHIEALFVDYYWVSKHGAVRRGRVLSESIPITLSPFRKEKEIFPLK